MPAETWVEKEEWEFDSVKHLPQVSYESIAKSRLLVFAIVVTVPNAGVQREHEDVCAPEVPYEGLR